MKLIIPKPRPPEDDDYPLMDLTEAAKRLGMSVKTLMRRVETGQIRYINIGTANRKVRRFTPKNLRTFIANQKVKESDKCQCLPTKKVSIKLNSSSKGIGFVAMQKLETEKKPKH